MKEDMIEILKNAENTGKITYDQVQFIRSDFKELENTIKRQQEKLSDISQYAHIVLDNKKLSERVKQSQVISIINRITD